MSRGIKIRGIQTRGLLPLGFLEIRLVQGASGMHANSQSGGRNVSLYSVDTGSAYSFPSNGRTA